MRSHLSLPVILAALAGGLVLSACCTGTTGTGDRGPSWSVTPDGFLEIEAPVPATVHEQILEENATLTLTEISFRNIDTEVHGLLATSPVMHGAVILAPGAGITKEMERNRVRAYSLAGCPALVLDLRGNGGETTGRPFDPREDLLAFDAGSWPGFYKTVSDLIVARELLSSRLKVPVYAMGASNGGRYAAIATAADPGFAGYIGVSTSGFGLAGDMYSSRNISLFLLSIDPDHAIGRIAPRPVWIFHSRRDTIIPFGQGEALFSRAGNPKEFIVFNGTHGENDEVDRAVTGICASP